MRKTLLISLLALVCGCESFRHQYSPEARGVPRVGRRYALKECNVYDYSKQIKEHHRDAMNARSFADAELREIEGLYPDVFSPDGVPVSIRLCYDMDRYDSGNPFIGLLDVFLFLGTVGVVPLVSSTEEYAEVELLIGTDNKKSPRVGVVGSSRCVIWTLGLNLLFPFGSPDDSNYSVSGRACIGMPNEKHSFSAGKKCRMSAYAYAIASALTEYEKSLSNSKKSAPSVIGIGELPL